MDLMKSHFYVLIPVHFRVNGMDFLVNLDPNASISMHRQIYEEVRLAILSGRLVAGHKMPSTRALSQSLGISRATVTMSYEYLLSEGYFESLTGSGTYVSRHIPEDLLHVDADLSFEATSELNELSETVIPAKHKRLSWYGQSLASRNWLDFPDAEPRIQFTFGRPDLDEFPMRVWTQLLSKHLAARDLTSLDCPTRAKGHLPLRQALAGYLASARAVHCDPERIIIVSGSQQAIALVTRVLIDREDYAAIEEPGYLGAQKAMMASGANLIPIQVDHAGVRVEDLKKKFDAASGLSAKLLYVTPSHQYPTGVALALPRRLDLLAWAARTGTYIVEDDYDSEFRYKGRPIPALAGLDKNGSVIYIGTFSKVLFPALRLGYLVVPENLVDVFARAKWIADRHSPLLDQQVLTEFITEGHLERHIRKMRGLYEQRRKLFVDNLRLTFGNRISILGDNAGINVLVRFNTECGDEELVQRAAALGVGLSSTKKYYIGQHRPHEFLLNYGGLKDEELLEGIRVIASILDDVDSTSDQKQPS
jgi:GntR family transcriptional regulator / MocR family aminotransferase